jgi:hypothetical protein
MAVTGAMPAPSGQRLVVSGRHSAASAPSRARLPGRLTGSPGTEADGALHSGDTFRYKSLLKPCCA